MAKYFLYLLSIGYSSRVTLSVLSSILCDGFLSFSIFYSPDCAIQAPSNSLSFLNCFTISVYSLLDKLMMILNGLEFLVTVELTELRRLYSTLLPILFPFFVHTS